MRKFIELKAIAVAAPLILCACDWGGPAEEQAPPMVVQVVSAQRTDVPLFFEMVGSTLGNQDVPIRARVEGFLETRDFDEGSFVKKGDLLYTIDPQPFQAKLVAAKSQLAGRPDRLAPRHRPISAGFARWQR